MTNETQTLINELKREIESHDLTKREIIELEGRYKNLRYAFNELLDYVCQKREASGFDDIEEIRYRFMELSGLLEL